MVTQKAVKAVKQEKEVKAPQQKDQAKILENNKIFNIYYMYILWLWFVLWENKLIFVESKGNKARN